MELVIKVFKHNIKLALVFLTPFVRPIGFEVIRYLSRRAHALVAREWCGVATAPT